MGLRVSWVVGVVVALGRCCWAVQTVYMGVGLLGQSRADALKGNRPSGKGWGLP